MNVRVMCRVRPMNEKEKELLHAAQQTRTQTTIRATCVEFNPDDSTTIDVYTEREKPDKERYERHSFAFDYVFDCNAVQANVYDIVAKPLVDSKEAPTPC